MASPTACASAASAAHAARGHARWPSPGRSSAGRERWRSHLRRYAAHSMRLVRDSGLSRTKPREHALILAQLRPLPSTLPATVLIAAPDVRAPPSCADDGFVQIARFKSIWSHVAPTARLSPTASDARARGQNDEAHGQRGGAGIFSKAADTPPGTASTGRAS